MLSEEQKGIVAQWFAAGAGVAKEKVLHPERAQFRYAQSATVHGLYHGPVALTLFY